MKLVEIVRNASGEVQHVKVEALVDFKEKLKGYIHWVSKDHSVDAIVRNFSYLFTVEEVPNDTWEQFLNPESLVTKENAKVWKNIENSKESDRF